MATNTNPFRFYPNYSEITLKQAVLAADPNFYKPYTVYEFTDRNYIEYPTVNPYTRSS